MTNEEIILRAYELWQTTETNCEHLAFMVQGSCVNPFNVVSVNRNTGNVYRDKELLGNIFNPVPEY